MTDVLTRARASTAARAELSMLIREAARAVPPLWPLDSAIAVNPLAGLEHHPFEEALRVGAELYGARPSMALVTWRRLVAGGRLSLDDLRDSAIERLGGLDKAFASVGPDVSPLDCLLARLMKLGIMDRPQPAADRTALLVAKWCASFFDRGGAATPMPRRDNGLYAAVLACLPHDPEFRRLGGHKVLGQPPADPLETISGDLARRRVHGDAREVALRRFVARLPGWAGHIRWQAEHGDEPAGAPADMADLIALLIVVDRAIGYEPAPPPPAAADEGEVIAALSQHFGTELDPMNAGIRTVAALDDAELGLIFQRAAERSYRDALIARLPRCPLPKLQDPDAQLVFCIDVRSEPFRRALEAEGNYETFGYAGFFGLPIATHAPHRAVERRLPVLIQPQHDVALRAEPGTEDRLAAERHQAARRDLLQFAKTGAATGFATAEAMGPLAGLAMLANGLAPRLMARWRERSQPKLAPSAEPAAGASGLSLAERVTYARALFALTGMDRQTAPLVVLVGHRGEALNNPYAAALDCGACGGHGGKHNARLLADILNDPQVRTELASDGQPLPATTLFVAGEHCTTTDQVTLPDPTTIPTSHAAAFAKLAAALERAGERNRKVRAAALSRSPDDLEVGATHWAEVRPEWGLAGAASFIVGPRRLTSAVDLEGRAFLHSYDWQGDPEGEALDTILTAPMVVAQWISCQYLFSTIDPDRYGAGDKAIHNPTGLLGVVRGNGGDLCVGLPRQSIFRDDGLPFHLPVRLLTVVHAPLNRVEAVVERHAILRRLFGNGWVQLVVIDPCTGRVSRWREDQEVDAPGAPAPLVVSARSTLKENA